MERSNIEIAMLLSIYVPRMLKYFIVFLFYCYPIIAVNLNYIMLLGAEDCPAESKMCTLEDVVILEVEEGKERKII